MSLLLKHMIIHSVIPYLQCLDHSLVGRWSQCPMAQWGRVRPTWEQIWACKTTTSTRTTNRAWPTDPMATESASRDQLGSRWL